MEAQIEQQQLPFQRRDEFDQELYLRPLSINAQRFLQVMYRAANGTPDAGCDGGIVKGTKYFLIAEQIVLADLIGVSSELKKDSRQKAVRRTVEELEQLGVVRRKTFTDEEDGRTVQKLAYVLCLVALIDLPAIDLNTTRGRAFAAILEDDPFETPTRPVKTATDEASLSAGGSEPEQRQSEVGREGRVRLSETANDSSDRPAEVDLSTTESNVSDGLSGHVSGGLSDGLSGRLSDPYDDNDDLDSLKNNKSSSQFSPEEIAELERQQAAARFEKGYDEAGQFPASIDVASAANPRSFCSIDDKDVRRIAGYAVDGGQRVKISDRRRLLAAYFASAVRKKMATNCPEHLEHFARLFCATARTKKGSGAWIMKCWTNFVRNDREPVATAEDKARAAELIESADVLA